MSESHLNEATNSDAMSSNLHPSAEVTREQVSLQVEMFQIERARIKLAQGERERILRDERIRQKEANAHLLKLAPIRHKQRMEMFGGGLVLILLIITGWLLFGPIPSGTDRKTCQDIAKSLISIITGALAGFGIGRTGTAKSDTNSVQDDNTNEPDPSE